MPGQPRITATTTFGGGDMSARARAGAEPRDAAGAHESDTPAPAMREVAGWNPTVPSIDHALVTAVTGRRQRSARDRHRTQALRCSRRAGGRIRFRAARWQYWRREGRT